MRNLKILLILGITILAMMGCKDEEPTIVVTCIDGIQNGTETGVDCGGTCDPCYGVGLPGESLGIIFYDKGSYSDGWRYLEAANFDISFCNPSGDFSSSAGTEPGIGKGDINTQLLNALMSGEFCHTLASNYESNGFEDWFLPSKNELTFLYENKDIIPNLELEPGECHAYWNSTLELIPNIENWKPKIMIMATGEFSWYQPSLFLTRPIRKF